MRNHSLNAPLTSPDVDAERFFELLKQSSVEEPPTTQKVAAVAKKSLEELRASRYR